ncbi:MAG TPA: hypothetical protein VFG35_17395 [Actinoplanes sp.]|nr:hypothetical protein [Actinoplanes sp.]
MTGTLPLLRFLLRRERMSLPWWLLGVTLLVLVQSVQSQNLYGSPEALQKLRQTIGANNAVIAMSGPTGLLESIGGEVVFEIFAFASIVVALMSMFLIGRHTRADEESGRAELIRSARVGQHAVGLVFASLTAAAAQVFENTRAVYGTVAMLLGAAFALRAAGDVGNGALSWASPLGWGQRTFPYSADRWWPVVLSLAFTTLLVATAVLLLAAGLSALLAAAFGVSSVLRIRAEESADRAEVVLATPTSRWTWLASQLSVSLTGTALTLIAFGLGEGRAHLRSCIRRTRRWTMSQPCP